MNDGQYWRYDHPQLIPLRRYSGCITNPNVGYWKMGIIGGYPKSRDMVKHPEIGMGLETSHKWPRVHGFVHIFPLDPINKIDSITIEYASVDNFLTIGIPVLYHYDQNHSEIVLEFWGFLVCEQTHMSEQVALILSKPLEIGPARFFGPGFLGDCQIAIPISWKIWQILDLATGSPTIHQSKAKLDAWLIFALHFWRFTQRHLELPGLREEASTQNHQQTHLEKPMKIPKSRWGWWGVCRDDLWLSPRKIILPYLTHSSRSPELPTSRAPMLLAAAQRLPQAHHNREEGIKRDASPAKPQKNCGPVPGAW